MKKERTNTVECFKNKDRTKMKLNHILYVEAFDDEVFLQDKEQRFKIRMRLYEFEKQYQTEGFIRINKSEVVNILQVKKVTPLFNSKLKLVLHNEKVLYVTRTYLKSFKSYLITGGGHVDY